VTEFKKGDRVRVTLEGEITAGPGPTGRFRVSPGDFQWAWVTADLIEKIVDPVPVWVTGDVILVGGHDGDRAPLLYKQGYGWHCVDRRCIVYGNGVHHSDEVAHDWMNGDVEILYKADA
jgi:hypothetical protein